MASFKQTLRQLASQPHTYCFLHTSTLTNSAAHYNLSKVLFTPRKLRTRLYFVVSY